MDNDLGAIVDGILHDPTQMERLRGMIKSLGITGDSDGAETQIEQAETAAQVSVPDEGGDLGDMLGGMLRDPAMMARLPGIVSMLKPMMAQERTQEVQPGNHKSHTDQRTALLLALRPYLSGGRREMLDALINLGRLGELLMRESGGERKEKR